MHATTSVLRNDTSGADNDACLLAQLYGPMPENGAHLIFGIILAGALDAVFCFKDSMMDKAAYAFQWMSPFQF